MIQKDEQKFDYSEISNTPSAPGIYAWYYMPEITVADIQETISVVQNLRDKGDQSGAELAIEDILEKSLFRFFKEEPYHAHIQGPLKPKYEGNLSQINQISTSLVKRLSITPERLFIIKEAIETSAPLFSSPLYIGMSDNLRKRLKLHKSLIARYRQREIIANDITGQIPSNPERSFAAQVCDRKMVPSRLFVITRLTKSQNREYTDIENILNRINYPLLGRN